VDDGQITARELREKAGHQPTAKQDGCCEHGEHEHDSRGHGLGKEASGRHTQMIEPIADCQAVLVRGMGQGAYIALQDAKIMPIVTDVEMIEEAMQAYIDGTIVNHPDKLH
jgi:predicted Fe-Mo cluster-binding NifX family protein